MVDGKAFGAVLGCVHRYEEITDPTFRRAVCFGDKPCARLQARRFANELCYDGFAQALDVYRPTEVVLLKNGNDCGRDAFF